MPKHSELLGEILKKRGITDESMAEKFLSPDYERDIHDPYLMRDMERACVRVYEAIDAGEKIVIYADYDCDGIPGAVVLSDLFKLVGYTNYEVYIPQRNSEGYGLNLDAVKGFADSGVKLIITVDLGITAVAEVAQAESNGIDVIITDHHLPPAILPRAYAILNPKVDNYPEKMLCGAGVAWKFACGFIKKYGEFFKIKNGAEKWMLDMVGIATLSDMVPLVGENRTLAYFGLLVLRKSPRRGLVKLLSKLNINQTYLVEDDITFMIAPRLNAASRMDDPMRAYELLSTTSAEEANNLAEHLSKINDERKTLVTGIMREVKKKMPTRGDKAVIVVGNPEWRVGVLGLVAGKISDEYKRPVFVWGRDENDQIKGSCRSDGSVSVVELMTESRDSFIDFGGHELAGGFTAQSEKIHFLEETLSLTYTKIKRIDSVKGERQADVTGGLSLVNMKTWRDVEKISPCGLGNPKPVFHFRGVNIENVKKFGKNGGEHLEIIFADSEGYKATAISFFSGEDSFEVPILSGKTVDLYATLELSRFRGRAELRLRIEEIC